MNICGKNRQLLVAANRLILLYIAFSRAVRMFFTV
jgi:hypothetical protein